MRLVLLPALLFLACAAPSSLVPDAGSEPGSDAGAVACDGGAGPPGGCPAPKGPCDECGSAADCPAGEACTAFGACRLCSVDQGGRLCSNLRCLKGDECCSGQFCVQPDDPEPCGGACQPPVEECGVRQPCPDAHTCEEVSVRCACEGPSHLCVPSCPTRPCGDGLTCDAASGHCLPTPCPTFACRTDQTCLRSGGDAHGCAAKPCAGHADCPGGFCFDGHCRAAAGRCELEVVRP